MGKRIAFPGSYYDTRRFEAWLSRHAAEGRRFCEFTSHGKMTVFEPEEPRRVQYYVEPDFGQYTAEEKEKAYAETVKSIMSSISPDLIAAIEMGGKCDLMSMMAEHMSPYALANGESVVETTQKLLNGLPFDVREVMTQLHKG